MPEDPESQPAVPATPGDARPVAERYRPFDGYPLKDQWDEDESE